MLGLQNKARRKAGESRKSPSPQPQSARASKESTENSTDVGVLGLETRSTCGLNCWARQVNSQTPDVNTPSPSRLNDQVRDQAARINLKTYEGLRPWQTRLIALQPGDLGSEIQCRLVDVDVIDGSGFGISGTAEAVTYEALSYSWGNPTLLYSITCNGNQFAIGEELAYALQFLRSPDIERYLWCDAICINQQDLEEKARQVKNMLRIFEKSQRVIAWLGRPHSGSVKFFKAINLLSSAPGVNIAQKHEDSCGTALREIASAASQVLASTWFKRTWIRQEVYAARKLTLQSGHLQSDFSDFLGTLARFGKTLRDFAIPDDVITVPPTLKIYKTEYQHFGSDGPSFRPKASRPTYVQYCLDIIGTGLGFDVTNEKDRIYGALGLLTSRTVRFFAKVPGDLERMAEMLPIDYNKSLEQVHEDIVKFLINTTGTLEILDIFHVRQHSSGPMRPVWNLDLGKGRQTFYTPWVWSRTDAKLFKATLQNLDLNDEKLRLAGSRAIQHIHQLDRIKEIGHPRDRFSMKYRRSITLRHIVEGQQRRSAGGLSSAIDNPPYAFVFSYLTNNGPNQAVSMSHTLVRNETIHASFATFLSSSTYAFAYIQDLQAEKSFDLASLHFLVPCNAGLDDMMVSLHGSMCLHLVRPLQGDPPEFKYLGPIAAVAIGQESINKYQSSNMANSSSRTPPEGVKSHDSPPTEVFVLR